MLQGGSALRSFAKPRQCSDGEGPTVYIRHILDAVSNIEADTAGYDFQKFRGDRRARQLVERNLEILSEASRRLPDELKAAEPQIPWRPSPVLAMFCAMTITKPI